MWYPRVRRLTHVSKVRSSQVKCFVLVFVVVLVLDFVRAQLWSDGVLEYRAAANCIRYAGLRVVKWCVQEMPPCRFPRLTLGLVRELVRPL